MAIRMNARLVMRRDNLRSILDTVGLLTRTEVLVGFPEDGAARRDPQEPTNAMLAYIHNFGSPANNIPARPFMYPGIHAIQEQAISLLSRAAVEAMRGHPERVMQIMNSLGLLAQASVRRAITIGDGWPPLSPRTIAERRARGRRGVHPLIDTGQLRQAVTYVVRRAGGRVTDRGVFGNPNPGQYL